MIHLLLTIIVNFIAVATIIASVCIFVPMYQYTPVILEVMKLLKIPFTIDYYAYFISSMLIILAILISLSPLYGQWARLIMGAHSPDGVDKEYIHNLLEVIRSVSQKDLSSYKFYIVEDSDINACAIGRCIVVINRGSLNHLEPLQLAGIIAHELGHLECKHTTYGAMVYSISQVGALVQRLLWIVLRILSFLLYFRIPIVSWIIVFIIWIFKIQDIVLYYFLHIPNYFIGLFFGRRNEYEADAYACRIGFGEGLHSALSVLLEVYGESQGGFFDRLNSTHPYLSERIYRIAQQTNLPT